MMVISAHSPCQSAKTSVGANHVVACVDRSDQAGRIIPHAFTIAQALCAPVTLLQVLEAQPGQELRPDPIEWDLRRHSARSSLRDLAAAQGDLAEMAKVHLAEGHTAEEICRFAYKLQDPLLVLGTQGEHDVGRKCIGGTVHTVLDRARGSILLVPGTANTDAAAYKRILILLDGSPWAESVVPLALRVARAAEAELILVHVVPKPELTAPMPLEPEDIELRRHVVERNEHIASVYLERLRACLAAEEVPVRVVLVHGDDVRSTLARLITTEAADLVILSARGHGGAHASDMRYGNVSNYLISHASVPILIVHPPTVVSDPRPVAGNHFMRRAYDRSV